MTTMAEPEWDTQTRALVLADVAHDSTLCPLCGRPKSVCHNPLLQDNWIPDDPVRCHATTALLLRQKSFNEETNPAVQALLWSVRLIGEEESDV